NRRGRNRETETRRHSRERVRRIRTQLETALPSLDRRARYVHGLTAARGIHARSRGETRAGGDWRRASGRPAARARPTERTAARAPRTAERQAALAALAQMVRAGGNARDLRRDRRDLLPQPCDGLGRAARLGD